MSDFSNLKHLFFDLDHTLWDFDYNSRLTYLKIFSERGLTLDLDVFMEEYIPLNQIYWKRFRESEINQVELRYQRLKSTFDACEYPIDDSLINLISDDYISYLPGFNQLFQGTHKMLKKLQKQYQLHIITNGFDAVQHKKLKNSNLYDYFKVIVTADSAGFKKPDQRIFLKAMDLASALPENSLMIGDSYEADIQGALGVGMRYVWFTPQELSTTSPNQINSLAQLEHLLVN